MTYRIPLIKQFILLLKEKIMEILRYGFATLSNNKIFGMTHYGGEHDKGIIFSVNEDSSDFKIIHSFNDKSGEGYSPYGSLKLFDGYFYGTTQEGGENKRGSIFRISTDGKKYETLMTNPQPVNIQ